MEKHVIISELRFKTEAGIAAYANLTNDELPRRDVEFTEATKIVVGNNVIVVYGRYGRRMAVLSRKDYRGMAIDGTPYVIMGDEFEPFTIEDAEPAHDTDGACAECDLTAYVEE